MLDCFIKVEEVDFTLFSEKDRMSYVALLDNFPQEPENMKSNQPSSKSATQMQASLMRNRNLQRFRRPNDFE